MPTLDFKGKQFVYAHHLSVPFRELKVDAKKSLPAAGAKPDLDDNLIIHGDNLHALKALLPQYAGKIKCIYIDPPYNTGNEGWCYNDNVRGPLIQEWLKESANPVDDEDLERHDKWLCMMWPRLQLLKELLSEDGVLFVSIDDNEVQHLKAILNEIFGEDNNFTFPLIWPLPRGINAGKISRAHEYILIAAKNINNLKHFTSREITYSSERCVKRIDARHPETEIVFPAGVRCEIETGVFQGELTGSEKVRFIDPVIVKDYKTQNAARISAGWTMKGMIERYFAGQTVLDLKGQKIEEIYFSKTGKPHSKKEINTLVLKTVLKNMPDYQDAKSEMRDIFADDEYFSYPKPTKLLEYLVSVVTKENDIILDSFAGSGTTGHAVLNLNAQDNKRRRFILVECEDYADSTTAERIRRVIKGIPNAENEILKSNIAGGFTFCTLGQEINIDTLLKGDDLPDYEALARYVFYTATGKTLEKVSKPTADWFIGETGMYNVHLIYKPDVEFLRGNQSALNADLVTKIQERGKGKKSLVFATAKFMGQKELSAANIDFCQLPYAIHRILGE